VFLYHIMMEGDIHKHRRNSFSSSLETPFSSLSTQLEAASFVLLRHRKTPGQGGMSLPAIPPPVYPPSAYPPLPTVGSSTRKYVRRHIKTPSLVIEEHVEPISLITSEGTHDLAPQDDTAESQKSSRDGTAFERKVKIKDMEITRWRKLAQSESVLREMAEMALSEERRRMDDLMVRREEAIHEICSATRIGKRGKKKKKRKGDKGVDISTQTDDNSDDLSDEWSSPIKDETSFIADCDRSMSDSRRKGRASTSQEDELRIALFRAKMMEEKVDEYGGMVDVWMAFASDLLMGQRPLVERDHKDHKDGKEKEESTLKPKDECAELRKEKEMIESELEKVIRMNSKEMEELRQVRHKYEGYIKSMEAEHDSVKHSMKLKIETCEREKQKLHARMLSIESTSRKSMEAMRREKAKQDAKMASLSSQVRQRVDLCSREEEKTQKLQEKVFKLEKDVKILHRSKRKLENENQNLEEDLAREMKDLQRNLDAYRSQVSKLEGSRRDLFKEIAVRKKELPPPSLSSSAAVARSSSFSGRRVRFAELECEVEGEVEDGEEEGKGKEERE
jgi:hypothetical protein